VQVHNVTEFPSEALRHPPNSLNPPGEVLEVSLHHAAELPVCREPSQASRQIELHVVTNATPEPSPSGSTLQYPVNS